MKKWYAIVMTIILVLTMTACQNGSSGSSKTEPSETTEPDDGVFIYYAPDGQASYSLSEIPYEMQFSDKVVPLERVTFFESYTDHGYTPYIVVTLSRENLTDDDIYWMTKYDEKKLCKEIDIKVYVDSEANVLESSNLIFIGGVYDDDNIYYSFFGDHSRYSFKGSRFTCQIIHAPTGFTESDTVYYHFDVVIDDSNYADADEVLTEGERAAFYQAIDNYLED